MTPAGSAISLKVEEESYGADTQKSLAVNALPTKNDIPSGVVLMPSRESAPGMFRIVGSDFFENGAVKIPTFPLARSVTSSVFPSGVMAMDPLESFS